MSPSISSFFLQTSSERLQLPEGSQAQRSRVLGGGECEEKCSARMSTPTHTHMNLHYHTHTHTYQIKQTTKHHTHHHTHTNSYMLLLPGFPHTHTLRRLHGLIGVIIFAHTPKHTHTPSPTSFNRQDN